jgi:DinB family protein
MASPAKSLARIRAQSERIRALLASRDLRAPVPRSAWSVGEQLDHTIKVASSSIQVLLKPVLPTLPRGINFTGRMVLLSGWIPRGVGKAPEKLTGIHTTADELHARLAELDTLIDRALASATAGRDGSPVLRHPMFGGLSFAQAIEFVVIHTDHHLKIVG